MATTGMRDVLIHARRQEADGVVSLDLRAAEGDLPAFSAGAHIDVEVPVPGGAVTRQYSLCNDPAETHRYVIGVGRDAAGRGGSLWLCDRAAVGDRLRVSAPRNHFPLVETASHSVLVAGGIGITPIAAMAARAHASGMDYTLHYSGRRRSCMAFADELAVLHGTRLHLHVADEGGRADYATLFAEVRHDTRIYACGPQRLLDALGRAVQAWPGDTLRVEHFHAAAGAHDASQDRPFTVELRDSGLTLPVRADQTLLDALRKANIDLQSDCEEGLCGSCEVRVVAGEVDHRDRVLTRSERDAHQRMMSCCSRARGTALVLDL